MIVKRRYVTACATRQYVHVVEGNFNRASHATPRTIDRAATVGLMGLEGVSGTRHHLRPRVIVRSAHRVDESVVIASKY